MTLFTSNTLYIYFLPALFTFCPLQTSAPYKLQEGAHPLMTEESPGTQQCSKSTHTQTPQEPWHPEALPSLSDNLVCVLWIKRRTRKRVYLDLKMQFGLFFFFFK